jgi:signal transduction histidine kinase
MTAVRNWRTWAWAMAGAAVLTTLTTAQSYASRRVEGISARIDRIAPIQAIDWFAWALLVPVMIDVAAAIEWRDRPRLWLLARWTGLAVGFSVVHALIEVIVARAFRVVPTSMPFATMLPARVAETLVGSLIVVGVVVLSYYAVTHHQQAVEREQRGATLEARLAEARLNMLRHQLQPHFLFNTLHTISALITDDVAAARRVITRLGDLLRSSLDNPDIHEVPLSQELLFLGHYLDIQRMRFDERLRTSIVAPADVHQALVPSMLLQPLVENAIRYAVEPRAGGGSVGVAAAREGMMLVIQVVDDGPGIRVATFGRQGIGLANTRARLAQLYGPTHELTLANGPTGGLHLTLRIPYRER